MPYTELIPCNNYSVLGIKSLKICTHQVNGQAIVFPLNIVLTNDTDYIVEVQDDIVNQVVTIGGQQLDYVIVDSVENCTYVDERVEARQGVYYQKTVEINVPKLQNYTDNQIMDFLFNVIGNVAIANVVVLIVDSNGNKLIIGWDSPAIMQGGNLQLDAYDTTANQYTYTFISKSANRTYYFVNI